MMLRRFALASILLIASSAAPAMAGTATANLGVSAVIGATCTIDTAPLNFGSYDPLVVNLTAPLEATGTIFTNCTTGLIPKITLSQGSNDTAGTPAAPARNLKSGAGGTLSYNLYSDSARTIVWGSAGAPTTSANGTAQTNTVYGRIPGAQTGADGTYTDTVIATVSF